MKAGAVQLAQSSSGNIGQIVVITWNNFGTPPKFVSLLKTFDFLHVILQTV